MKMKRERTSLTPNTTQQGPQTIERALGAAETERVSKPVRRAPVILEGLRGS